MPTQSPDLSTRYGTRHAPRWVWVVVAVVLIGAGVAWAWWASQSVTDPVSAQVHSFDVQSEHSTEITLEVHRRDDGAATCEVYAQAMDHTVVGERTIDIAYSDADTVTVSSVIRTDRKAANALVRGCRKSG
ncbi:MAG: DUF4307 domain-containing protein [Nocardioidaceae bacterium]